MDGTKREEPKKGRRFSQEQYDMLKRCSDKKDMTEWNKWREQHRKEDIKLEGVKFNKMHLKDVNLNGGRYEDRENKELIRQGEVYLKDTEWWRSDLQGAEFRDAHLEGAFFYHAGMQRAVFQGATVDSYTEFWKCDVDCDTNFRGVALGSVTIDPGAKAVLECNIRRKNWENWYKEHPRLKWLVKIFWWISDYGRSTSRIIFTFFGLALIFANIYYHWGRIAPPGIVKYLFVDRSGIEVQSWLVPLRTLYFSIVTMTTLGFGDMYANAQSILGHLLLMIQVILGYVL
ncbi:pentapeptide repeat-containing protein, partial [bacterium]|nr:pentapeptide repeat-containing protein [bacterium]